MSENVFYYIINKSLLITYGNQKKLITNREKLLLLLASFLVIVALFHWFHYIYLWSRIPYYSESMQSSYFIEGRSKLYQQQTPIMVIFAILIYANIIFIIPLKDTVTSKIQYWIQGLLLISLTVPFPFISFLVFIFELGVSVLLLFRYGLRYSSQLLRISFTPLLLSAVILKWNFWYIHEWFIVFGD